MPLFETFIDMINALPVLSGLILCEVVHENYQIKTSAINDQLKICPGKTGIPEVVEVLISYPL